MTLARTALRLQAIEVLNADPVVGPACEGRIFDSRLAELSHLEPVPVIVVTTEETKGEGWSRNNGGAPFNTACDLVLEIAMTAVAVDDQGAAVGIFAPATDGELEADLDLLEECAMLALTVGETGPARILRRAVTRRAPEYKSSRFATDDTGEKLAIRLVTLRVELKGEARAQALDLPTGTYAMLPDPLRTVAENLPADTSGRATVDKLAARLTIPNRRPLRRATFGARADAPDDASGTPDPAALPGLPLLVDFSMQPPADPPADP